MSAAQPIVIYGQGGHGRVIAEAAALSGFEVLGFFDDRPGPNTLSIDTIPDEAAWIVGIGDNATRMELLADLLKAGREIVSVIHPRAFVSPRANIEAGSFVGPMAVVHTDAWAGQGAIINSGAVVEHDVQMEPGVHVAPQAVLGGASRVGQRSLIGTNATVNPGVQVGRDCVVGSGGVVLRDVPDGRTVVGVPVRPLKR